MQKPIMFVAILLTASLLLPANAPAQQTPANPPQTPAAKPQQPAPSNAQPAPAGKPQTAPATGAQKSPAAKTARPPVKRTQPVLTLKTQKDKLSYALGMNIGTGMHAQSIDIDPDILARGLKDTFAAGKMLLTEDEARTTLMAFQTEMRKKQQEKTQLAAEAMKKVGVVNQKAGEEFLAANKSADGVVTLPSGLQYKILQEGTGPKPIASDSVVCNYRGTLLDGTEFDSSYKRGQPATFPVTGVIKGWTEALPLMPVGSKWQLFIPAELAYGERSPSPTIGPNSTLIFEVELLSIQPKADQPKPKDVKPDAPKPAPANPLDKPMDKPADKPNGLEH